MFPKNDSTVFTTVSVLRLKGFKAKLQFQIHFLRKILIISVFFKFENNVAREFKLV